MVAQAAAKLKRGGVLAVRGARAALYSAGRPAFAEQASSLPSTDAGGRGCAEGGQTIAIAVARSHIPQF
jgi:hypothetical protein